MRHTILLLLCFLSPCALAALHKCVDAQGRASYQSLPCADTSRTEWVREVSPEPSRDRPPVLISVPTPVRTTAPVRVRGTGTRPAPSRCDKARRAAEETRDRQWNRLGFKQRSELDARVARACARR